MKKTVCLLLALALSSFAGGSYALTVTQMIESSMSMREVVSILGEPTRASDLPNGTVRYSWTTESSSAKGNRPIAIVIDFEKIDSSIVNIWVLSKAETGKERSISINFDKASPAITIHSPLPQTK